MSLQENSEQVCELFEDAETREEMVEAITKVQLKAVKNFRQDLIDFLETQPDWAFKKQNILAVIRNLKPEMGR